MSGTAAAAMPTTSERDVVGLQTRLLRDIANEIYRGTPIDGDRLLVTDIRRKYFGHGFVHRTTSPCGIYNCHGLTFASRRTAIVSTEEIYKILSDDGYVQIARGDVQPGDVIVYFASRDAGSEAEHSGIVVSVEMAGITRNLRVLSKWGRAHELIHPEFVEEYAHTHVRYFRIET